MYFKNRGLLVRALQGKILINQSAFILEDTDIELLSIGLNFIPPLPRTREEIENDLDQAFERWERSINTTLTFAASDSLPLDGWIHDCVPSSWSPPTFGWENDHLVITARNAARLALTPAQFPSTADTIRVRNSIRRLQNDSIHILKADKGRCTVVWDSSQYDTEALRQLSDSLTYEELPAEEFHLKLAILANQVQRYANSLFYLGHITTRESEALATTLAGNGSPIYFLPKIHKQPNPVTSSYPGRPIVATYSSPIHLIDKLLTNLTASLIPIIPGSLRDSAHLVELLRTPMTPPLSPDSVVITADVDSLYPSIPWEEGISAATEFYSEHRHILRGEATRNRRPNPLSVGLFNELLRLVISNSYIHFKNRRFFHQKSGTAMGMCISVFFANTYMYAVTKIHITTRNPWVRLFLRYIDDIFVIFSTSCPSVHQTFFQAITRPGLGYTIDPPRLSQSFLDLLVSIDPNTLKIEFEPYWKPTSSGSYLHPASSHPSHVIRAIPYSQFLRLLRISSTPDRFIRAASRLRRDLITSGYRKRTITEAYVRVLNQTRRSTSARTTRNHYVVTTYEPNINQRQARLTSRDLNRAVQVYFNTQPTNIHTSTIRETLASASSNLVCRNGRSINSYFSAAYKQGPTQ